MTRKYQLFPVRDQWAWEMYQLQIKAFWTVGELDFGNDQNDSALLSTDERRLLLQILAFFAASDLVVNDTLFRSILSDSPTEEFTAALTAQMFMETIHSETYARLIDNIANDDEKTKLFNSLESVPSIKAKKDWYLKRSTGTLAQRAVIQVCVEGIHFSSSFAVIAWLRKRHPGKFQGVTKSNEFIMRDEGLHAQMACELYKREEQAGRGLSTENIKMFVRDAVDLEQNFVHDAFAKSRLWGLNAESLSRHVQFIADYWLVQLGVEKMYKTPVQFDWLETSLLPSRSNFFEERESNYQKAEITAISFDEDF